MGKVIEPRRIAKAKVEHLKNGFSAFAESNELVELIEKYIAEQKLNVNVDKTPLGCWFIPQKD
ncbi:hypothetical protein BSNK01_24880 [Bacillaceae bacterium]